MKKLKVLLSESTIVNFSFLTELFKRYPLVGVFTPLITFGLSIFFYFGQNDIYRVSLSFKNVSDESLTPTLAIASLFGEKTNSMLPSEIQGLHRSVNFNQELASKVFNHPRFKDLNLNVVNAKDHYEHKEIFKKCKDDSCYVETLRSLLPNFWHVSEDETVDRRFFVNVMTLDYFTTDTLVQIIKDQIAEYRKKTIQHYIVEQRKVSEELIEQKKKELGGTGIFESQKEFELVDTQLVEVKNQLSILRQEYYSKKSLLEKSELKIQEITKYKANTYEITKSKKINDLEKKIFDLRRNVNEIELSGKDISGAELEILTSLKAELLTKEAEYKVLNPGRSLAQTMGQTETFRTDGDKDIEGYQVLKEQFATLEKDFNEQQVKLTNLEEKKASFKSDIEKNKSTLEYMKLLENKLIQLKLLESTVVSDLLFDKFTSGVSVFKRTTLPFVILFAFVLSSFLSLVVLVGLYLYDDRVFSADEISHRFNNLPILGSTPKFKN
jgi:hypothetical protein